jgi:hypothetical protein
MMTSGMVLRDEHVASRTFMIITRAMPTQQTAITGVSRRITAGQEIKAGLCRDPELLPRRASGIIDNAAACRY